MKKIICIIVFILSPVFAFSHPGKTNYVGGHKCWKGCMQWDLFYGEYHLHDKDFKPIRITRRPVEKAPEVAVPVPLQAFPSTVSDVPQVEAPEPAQQSVPERQMPPPLTEKPLPTSSEESFFPFALYLIALMALLLILVVALLVIRNRKRSNGEHN